MKIAISNCNWESKQKTETKKNKISEIKKPIVGDAGRPVSLRIKRKVIGLLAPRSIVNVLLLECDCIGTSRNSTSIFHNQGDPLEVSQIFKDLDNHKKLENYNVHSLASAIKVKKKNK